MARRRASASGELTLQALGSAGDAGALAHYLDPAYYTKTYARRREDVEYYLRLAQRVGGPVLEYGVGNGRIALELARAGIDVVGVDLSKTMLDDLGERLKKEPRAVRDRLRIRQGDMRTVRLRRRFPLVIAAFNTVLHLYTREEMDGFLAGVRSHLAPGGSFVFDWSVPRPQELIREPGRRYGAPRFRHPSTGKLTRYWESFEYDPLRQLLLVWMEFESVDGAEAWRSPLTHRQYFPAEMEALLAHAGFQELRWFADFTELPPDAEVDSMVVHCRVGRASPHRPRASLTK